MNEPETLFDPEPPEESPAQGVREPWSSADNIEAKPVKKSVDTSLAEQGFQQIDPRHTTLDQIASVIFGSVLVVGALIAALVMYFAFDLSSWLFLGIYAAALILALGILVLGFVFPPIEYRYIWWRLNDDGLEIRRGVFWQHQIAVPLARVQHADVSQGPFQRQYGLGTLTVNTAGTFNSSVSLEGLRHETAIELRDQLVRQGKAVNVV